LSFIIVTENKLHLRNLGILRVHSGNFTGVGISYVTILCTVELLAWLKLLSWTVVCFRCVWPT